MEEILSQLFIGELKEAPELHIEAYLASIASKHNQDAIGFVLNSRNSSLILKAA